MGSTTATISRINDLSLKVTAPDGITVYWGNNGLDAANTSAPGGVPNTIDTVENVFLQNPASGIWTVEVFATQVVQDAYLGDPAVNAPFSLVVSGGVQTGHVEGHGRFDVVPGIGRAAGGGRYAARGQLDRRDGGRSHAGLLRREQAAQLKCRAWHRAPGFCLARG